MKKLIIPALLSSVLAFPAISQAEPAEPKVFPGMGATFNFTTVCSMEYYGYTYTYTVFYLDVGATMKGEAEGWAQGAADSWESYGYDCTVTRTNPAGVEKEL